MTAPKKGDRVKATVEGVVSSTGITWFAVDNGGTTVFPDDEGVTVEVLPPSKPGWWPPKPGDLIKVSATLYSVDHDGEGRHFPSGAAPASSDFVAWIADWADERGWDRVRLLIRDYEPVTP